MTKLIPFNHALVNHIKNFVGRILDLDTKKTLFIAVSGGVDSMVLLDIFHTLYPKKVCVLHVNYGTRKESDKDQSLVENYCHEKSIRIESLKASMSLDESNFELKARELRYQFFKNFVGKEDLLLMGHHIDDSFEWSLMNQFKSSNDKGGMGIPVLNGNILRPLMSLTKEQIESYARVNSLKYAQDSSNLSSDFERNYLRNEVIPKIKSKYPQYLKHYVNRANRWAFEQGVCAFKEKTKTNLDPAVYKSEYGVSLICANTPCSIIKDKSREIIHGLSQTHRGEISNQLDKLIKMIDSGKRGPLNCSGGVSVYNFGQYLHFVTQIEKDLIFLKSLSSTSQIPNISNEKKYPFIYKGSRKNQKHLKSYKKQLPLIEDITQGLLDHGVWFQCAFKVEALLEKRPYLRNKLDLTPLTL